jgi:hypothetical protein
VQSGVAEFRHEITIFTVETFYETSLQRWVSHQNQSEKIYNSYFNQQRLQPTGRLPARIVKKVPLLHKQEGVTDILHQQIVHKKSSKYKIAFTTALPTALRL